MSDPLDDIIANLSTKIAAKKGNARAPELDEIEALEAKEAAAAKAAGQAAKAAAEASAANPSPWMQRQMANNPPLPGPSLAHELGQSAKEVGIGGAKALQAIPVAAGDAFSGGLFGRGEEAAGSVPPGLPFTCPITTSPPLPGSKIISALLPCARLPLKSSRPSLPARWKKLKRFLIL